MTAITSTGLGSGLDIKGMVASLVAAENTPTKIKLDAQEAKLTAKISSYGSLKSAMSSFQSSLTGLKNLSTFQKITATSSDPATVTATAFNNADLASYNLEVMQLAKAQTLASTSFSSATDTVGTGTLTIKFGTTTYDGLNKPTGFTLDGNQGALSLTVDATNNTLAGLSNAINQAKAGVTAAIVTDKSGSRLVLNSTVTGANNSMEISATNDASGTDIDTLGLSKLAYNSLAANMTQPQAAQDAKVAINGLEILSSSNTVDTALKGLKLNLLQAQPGKIVTVGVSQSDADITTAINGFVKGYNDLIAIVTPMTGFNGASKAAGSLQSDSTLRGAMASLRSELGNMVNGLNGSAKSLADLGITTQKDGTLALDSAKLTSQLASNRSGVTAVFAVLGRPSNANILVAASTADTQAGQYAVNITQVATQGVLTGASSSSFDLVTGSNTFAISVNGLQSGTIALTPKTYASYAELATEMQSRINGDTAIKAGGASVGVSHNGTGFVFTSKSYGASSQVAITAVAGDTTAKLGLSVAAGTAGVDVAGTIGGLGATGNGQTLTSTGGTPNGLSLLISDGTVGDKGTVDFSRGLIERLNKVMTGLLSSTGSFNSRTDSMQKDIADITKQRTKLANRMDKLQTTLYKQFNSMDTLLGKMQSTGSFINQQYFNIAKSN